MWSGRAAGALRVVQQRGRACEQQRQYERLSALVPKFSADLSSSNMHRVFAAYCSQTRGTAERAEYSQLLCGVLVKLAHKTLSRSWANTSNSSEATSLMA